MQLSRLEINGFKSFGDKVTINFDEGVTGVVGPNGCGKSNIVDAIRWVLGEQKIKSLRSDKMENVIFNGTKKRKATNLAEVSLTFNNTKNLIPTEYSQITITRRYFRTGESEYLMNGVHCRLKDINNLFMDTGIGSDSYAIIELKMVDDILNDKDNSRRNLFEEAAGISKFKQRKKETLRKLQDTDADLERVEDLLFEIDKNLKSLEKQARQAERYYKLKEEYKEFSVELARTSIGKQNNTFKELSKSIENENDRKLQLNNKIIEIEAEIEKLKTDLISKEKELSVRQKALNNHVNEIRTYENEKQIKNEQLRFLNNKSDMLREQIEQDRKSKDRAAFSIQSLNQEKEEVQRVLGEIGKQVEVLHKDYEDLKELTNQLQEEVNSLNQTLRSRQDEVYQLKKSIEIREIQINSFTQELEKTSTDSSKRSENLIEFEQKIAGLTFQISDLNTQKEQLKEDEVNLESRIENSGKTIEMIRDEIVQVHRKLDARQNEYNLTKSMIENLEGFPEAIKFLKKEAGWGKKVPLLSDIISCGEEYKVTIENFLESWMNHYVVEQPEEAYRAINLLSDSAKGKANFFILNLFEKFKPSSTQIFDNAFPATEILEFDPKYKKLVSFLFDNVFIVIGDYKEIPNHEDCIFITKNGKVTRKKFSISGGSVGLFEGKRIGRQKNLEKLEIEINSLNTKLDEAEQSRRDSEAQLESLINATHKEEIEELQNQINLLNEELISLKTKHEQTRELLSSTDTRKEDMIDKINQLKQEIIELQPKTENEGQELGEMESKLKLLTINLKEQNAILNEKSAAYNEENLHFHQQQNKVNSIDQELKFKESSLESSSERINKNSEELQLNEQDIQVLIANTASQDNELVKLYKEKEEKDRLVNEAEKDYYEQRGKIDDKEKEEREAHKAKEMVDDLLLELQNKLNETKLELNSVKERLSIEFNINLDDIMQQELPKVEDEEVDELKGKVTRTKERMEKMGPINPMAMEAYQEIQKRYEFITTQKQDLINAKESLLATIAEIDLVAKNTFLDAFEKIKGNFVKVFRSLFTEEDDCDLILSDLENPLESSVEIIAKPKGKKPITINQLSGGEKTLTATSLLFAIYLLKPAPFCIFDEVDAPLDDANIDKFNEIIKEFSKESQFIIVTHNKRTMVYTDVIYGITMIEQGVSRVVPVDLRELA